MQQFYCLKFFNNARSIFMYIKQHKYKMITKERNPLSKQSLRRILADMYKIREQIKANKITQESKQNLNQLVWSIYSLSNKAIDFRQNSIKLSDKFQEYLNLLNQIKSMIVVQVLMVYHDKFPFQIAYDINKDYIQCGIENASQICQQLFYMMVNKQIQQKVQQKHIIKISNGFQSIIKQSIKRITPNPLKGANPGFIIVTNNNSQYFVKTFTQIKTLKDGFTFRKIDCREMLGYKVLQFMGFGPETHFIIPQYQQEDVQDYEHQSMQVKGNYIITRNVCDIKLNQISQINDREFIRDGDRNVEHYEKALENKEFVIQLFALVCLNRILCLKDTFYDNPHNYGILKTITKKGAVKYDPMLIDHLPKDYGCSVSNFSAQTFLRMKFINQSKYSNLTYIINGEDQIFNNFNNINDRLRDEIKQKVENGKNKIPFVDSVNKAKKIIQQEIQSKGEGCFYFNKLKNNSPQNQLDQFVNFILDNFEKIRQL